MYLSKWNALAKKNQSSESRRAFVFSDSGFWSFWEYYR